MLKLHIGILNFIFDNNWWGSKFETKECRTTNVSEFQNYEY